MKFFIFQGFGIMKTIDASALALGGRLISASGSTFVPAGGKATWWCANTDQACGNAGTRFMCLRDNNGGLMQQWNSIEWASFFLGQTTWGYLDSDGNKVSCGGGVFVRET